MSAPIGVLACAATLLGGLASAAAQPDSVRNATAKLAANGIFDPERALPGQGGTSAHSDGSGVVVSEDGFILTTHHLIDKLGPVFGDSVKITAQLGGSGNARTAFVVDARPNIDLLLLKLQLPGPYEPFPLGSAYDIGDAPVHTYGFPAEGQYDVSDTGRITSRTVAGGYLWGTDLDFAEGQSGSPVYTEDGAVVAIAKGELGGGGAIIPIDYADPLIAFLRFREQVLTIEELQEFKSTIPRCRVCIKQAGPSKCFGSQNTCSGWSAAKSVDPIPEAGDANRAAATGWSEGIVLRAGGNPATESDSCAVQWSIECE